MALLKKFTVPATAALTVGALLLSATPGHALAQSSNLGVEKPVGYSQNFLSADEMKKLENDLETLFTRYVVMDSSGKFNVSYENIKADGLQAGLKDFEALASAFNMATPPEANVAKTSSLGAFNTTQGVGEFAGCVLFNGLGGNIIASAPRLISSAQLAIRAWNWGLAAATVARIVGPVVVKSLGGPWGIAVNLALAAPGCTHHL